LDWTLSLVARVVCHAIPWQVYFLYQTYKSAGSLLCFLDLIGLELFGGCHHAATLAKKLAKNNDFTPFVLNSTHMGIS
jgi:hypothetical protein